jgi:hypothetical protein
VVLKSLFSIFSELSDDICKPLDRQVKIKATISKVPWCISNTILQIILVLLNDLNIRITGAAPELDTITPNYTYNLLV